MVNLTPSYWVNVPASTLWHRKHGRPSKGDAAAQKQYLTPSEEKALADYILRWAERGYPVPVKLVRDFAWVIARKRSSTFQTLSNDDTIQPPGKNWPQGFGPHESLEVLQFCHENNIILCRLPSHTSHKLQPCDVGVFGPLKTAYREHVEGLERGGVNTIGKQHFTLLYDQARQAALTPPNIMSGWAKTGLYPFDPNRVLQDIPRPSAQACQSSLAEDTALTEGAAADPGNL